MVIGPSCRKFVNWKLVEEIEIEIRQMHRISLLNVTWKCCIASAKGDRSLDLWREVISADKEIAMILQLPLPFSTQKCQASFNEHIGFVYH